MDGRIYGSFEFKKANAFYVAIIDGNRIDRVGMEAGKSDILRTVYLSEVARDYLADLDGDGKFAGNTAKTADHRYGCSGVDGVGFGPAFGHTDGPNLLTLAYGIYPNLGRNDNDHQVLLQYDVSAWRDYERPFVESAPHQSGPDKPAGKYFVRTGNTTWGVQALAYDAALQRWFLGVYRGTKPTFPNYRLFAIDAGTPPRLADLVGVPGPKAKWEQGLVLRLAEDGLRDDATGIRGWNQKADMGLQPVGKGMFYLAVGAQRNGQQTADLTLHRWTGDPDHPFVAVTAADLGAAR